MVSTRKALPYHRIFRTRAQHDLHATHRGALVRYGYLRETVLIFPVYAIMMGTNGISPFELSMLFIVWSGSALVFEVPSGVLADRYSRKTLLVISGAVKGMCIHHLVAVRRISWAI